MQKLKHNLTYRDIYLVIRQRKSIMFSAVTDDIGLNDIEQHIQDVNIPFKFPFPCMSSDAIEALIQESVGSISMNPFEKIRFLVKFFDGEILCQKLNDNDEWVVMIIF